MSKIQIAFSFDSTGSMYPILAHVKRSITEAAEKLSKNNISTEIAIIVHNSYDNTIEVSLQNFTTNPTVIKNFITATTFSGGSNTGQACYEYAMQKARRELSWDDSASKCLVMLGDDYPYKVPDLNNKYNIDWKEECAQLKQKNIKIYAVKCLNNTQCETIYKQWASLTGGFFLEMHQFTAIIDFMLVIALHNSDSTNNSNNLENYRNELQAQNRYTRNLRTAYSALTGNNTDLNQLSTVDLNVVAPTRFQIMNVDVEKSIKEFTESNGIIFKTGKGFYEFTKPEEISEGKEIILLDNETGDFFEGVEARKIAKISDHVKGKKSHPPDGNKYKMFIQSKSTSRKLVAGTQFLYET